MTEFVNGTRRNLLNDPSDDVYLQRTRPCIIIFNSATSLDDSKSAVVRGAAFEIMDYDATDIASTYDRGRDHGPEFFDLWMNVLSSHVARSAHQNKSSGLNKEIRNFD